MKVLHIIFAFYLLFISVKPCDESSDMDNCGATGKNLTEQTSNTPSKPLTDICSPLCMCHCCSGTIFEGFKNYTVVAIREHVSVQYFYQQTETNSHLSSIWQPPRA